MAPDSSGINSSASNIPKIQHVSTEAEFRAKRDQDAILRLMDELAEFSNGDLTVEAQVTEDFTGAIADSVNYAIESMRELVGTINRTSMQVSNASNSTRLIAEQMQNSSTEQAQKSTLLPKLSAIWCARWTAWQ